MITVGIGGVTGVIVEETTLIWGDRGQTILTVVPVYVPFGHVSEVPYQRRGFSRPHAKAEMCL